MGIEVNQLECFVSAMQCGSFAKAARALHMTPQTLAKAVHGLERDLSVQLFRLNGRRMEPTEAGVALSTQAYEILAGVAGLRQRAAQCRLSAGRSCALVAVASPPLRGSLLVPADFSSLDMQSPQFGGIAARFTFRSSLSCLFAFESGSADAAIVTGPVAGEDVVCSELGSFPVGVAVSACGRLARKRELAVADLRGVPIMEPDDIRYCRKAIASHLRSRGVVPRFVAPDSSTSRCRERFLREGGAVFVVAHSASAGSSAPFVVKPLALADELRIPVFLVMRKGEAGMAASPALQVVEGAARSALARRFPR